MPSLLDVKAAHLTVSAWKARQHPLSEESLMASAQLAVLEWVMGNSMGVPCDGRFNRTLARMWRDLNFQKVLDLANVSRKARGLTLINQPDTSERLNLETATLPDLLLCEYVGRTLVTFRTKKDAEAVHRAWAEALPGEYGPDCAHGISGYTVRLPLVLQQFIRHQEGS